MRSINIKRTAAIVAGAAMMASVIAPAALAVTSSGEVDTLVASIKADPANTKVVVGTNGAAISDGIAAAKIAAVLASLNYEATTVSGDSLTCGTVGTPTVDFETTSSATISSSKDNFVMELAGTGSRATSYKSAAIGGATTANQSLTRNSFSPLKQYELTISDNSTGTMQQHTYYYEDQIIINGSAYVQYSEDTSGTSGKYGLYLYAPSGYIQYKIDFGTGIPIDNGINYQEVPEIEILGTKYGLDWKNCDDTRVSIYTGTKSILTTGDSTTTEDGVTVDFTSGTGTTTASGYFKITGPEGTAITTAALGTGDSYETTIDGIKTSVSVDSIGYDAANVAYTATVRIGTGTKKITEGSKFPMDDNWTVTNGGVMNASSAGLSTFKLTEIILQYGYAGKTMDYDFQGTYEYGLKEGTSINGPLKADGTPLYTMTLGGLGSKTTTYHTTDVTFEGKGNSDQTTPSHLIWVEWTSRGGAVQKFTPTQPKNAVFMTSTAKGNLSLNTTAAYTIINDKVVYFGSTEQTDTGLYNIKLKVGGIEGEEFTLANVNSSTGTTFEDNDVANPISCKVYPIRANAIHIDDIIGTDLAIGTDSTSLCDMYPDKIPVGDSTQFAASATANPFLNFTNGSSATAANNAITVLNHTWKNKTATTAKGRSYSVVTIAENNMAAQEGSIVVTWDSNVTGSNNFAGFKAGPGSIGLASATQIDQVQATLYDSHLHHVSNRSTVLDGTTSNKLVVTLSDAKRASYLTFAAGSATPGTSTSTGIGVGETASGVTIKAINVPEYTVSGATTGSYYVQKAVMVPEDVVTTDSAASGTYQIVVGGPYVNSVAAAMTAADSIKTQGASFLVAESNKLLVAGYSGTDTTAAANELIAKLK